MKNFDNKYFKCGITAFFVIGASIVLYFLLLRLDNIVALLGSILSIFKPLLYGIFIAFLLTQLFNYFDKIFTNLLSKKYKNSKKIKKTSNIISITLSILIMLLILFLVIYILVPQIINSLLGIISAWPTYTSNIEDWLLSVFDENTELKNSILDMVNNSSDSLLDWLTTALIPNLENLSNSLTNSINNIYLFLKDFVIGLVFSIYILTNKNKFIAGTKMVLYRLLGVKKANSLLKTGRYSYKIFVGFIKGKLITSLIIGTACYLGMVIIGIPYALLVSFIIAITNIIPFFGPIIGWAPSALLIALASPIDALYFSILCIILQQLEGNIIEPKIVGNITGISPFWVLFSIIIFGDLFGIIGMILGVPIFAVLYHFITIRLNNKLKKKGLPTNISDYDNLKYIDETTNEIIKN